MKTYNVAVTAQETRYYTDGPMRGKPYYISVWKKRVFTDNDLLGIFGVFPSAFLEYGLYQIMTTGAIELCPGCHSSDVQKLYDLVVQHGMKPGRYLKKYYNQLCKKAA